MKKFTIIGILALVATTTFLSCSKDKGDSNSSADFTTLQTTAITDFVNKTAIPGYTILKDKATAFDAAVVALKANPTDANLATAKQGWLDLRVIWEQCEGYLLGPVEDNDYDPSMDTWPVDYNQLDSVIASSNALSLADVQSLNFSLRGFHPAEYILWGKNGNNTAADITAKQMQYLTSLTQDVLNTCTATYNAWIPTSGNYAQTVLDAGKTGNTVFPTKNAFFKDLAGVISDICNEVGDSKMKEPYLAGNAQLVESPFSGNSTTDFKNNIIGAYAVYMGNFQGANGQSLHALVYAKNISLDAEIQAKFNTAINSFSKITLPYGTAIIDQKTQVSDVMTAVLAARDEIDGPLQTFIATYVK